MKRHYLSAKNNLIIMALIFFLTSCSTQNHNANSGYFYDMGQFSFRTDTEWRKTKLVGYDTYIRQFVIGPGDTVIFFLGKHAGDISKWTPKKNVYDHDYIIRNKISWSVIDGRRAKIVTPKRQGITGVYIDSLWLENEEICKFNISGEYLSRTGQKELLKAFKTLKFYENKKYQSYQ